MGAPNTFEASARVYIAGILMPFMRVSVTTAFNTPPTATVSLPPYSELFGIGRMDRIPIQIFVEETWLEDGEFILLFEGEITSFSYVSSGLSREIVVNAQSVLALLRDVNIQFMSSFEDIVKKKIIKGENNTAINTISPGSIFPMSLFMNGLSTVESRSLIKTPSQYLENAYRFMEERGSLDEANDSELAGFYSEYSKRIKLSDRYITLPYFDEVGKVWETAADKGRAFPLIDGLQIQAAMQQIQQSAATAMSVNRGPAKGSVYDLLNYMVGQMEYEYAFICTPKYEGGKMVCSCLKPILYESMPPSCNIVYRPMNCNIRTSEKVYQVPTRVRISNDRGPLASVGNDANDPLVLQGIIDYYPTEKYKEKDPSPDESNNWYASERLEEEKHTGTYMFDTKAPSWMSYITPESMGANDNKELKNRIMKHFLMLKRYEIRNMQAQFSFNPYLTPGFPGAIYDSDDQNFVFVGHVLTVNHEISKSDFTTTANMSFVRMVDEAIEEPLENTVPKINDITTDKDDMTVVYGKILGCHAVDHQEIKDMSEGDDQEFQSNPREAYKKTRRDVTTFDEYLEFMDLGITTEEEDEDGNMVPTVLSGQFVSDRMDNTVPDELNKEWVNKYREELNRPEPKDLNGIRWKLKKVADREFKNKVYI